MEVSERMTEALINTAEILAVIQDVWEDIRQVHPDVPEAIFAFGSGVRGKRLVNGHFAENTWQRDKETVHEVFISGEGLARGAVDTFGTLLHEAAHGIANTRGIQDTSRQGRYHNERFREIAEEELGLSLEKDPKIGWSPTTVPESAQAEWAPQIEALENVLGFYRLMPEPQEKKPSSNLPVLECRCPEPRKIRMSKKAREEGPVVCGVCESVFEEQEVDA
jgi:hypothetical protein